MESALKPCSKHLFCDAAIVFSSLGLWRRLQHCMMTIARLTLITNQIKMFQSHLWIRSEMEKDDWNDGTLVFLAEWLCRKLATSFESREVKSCIKRVFVLGPWCRCHPPTHCGSWCRCCPPPLLLAFVIVHRCLLDARLIVFYISFIGLCRWWWWRPWCTCLALELTTSFPSSCLSAFEASQRCTHPSNASADLGPQRTCTWPPNFKSSRFKSANPNFSGD